MKKTENEIPKYCEYCRFASSMTINDDMLCEKKGIVSKEYCCRKFVYDPLKRVPKKPPAFPIPDDLLGDL